MDSIQHSQDIYQLFSVIAIHPEKKQPSTNFITIDRNGEMIHFMFISS